jgi:Pyridoxamine 5'-phosphate oxidase
MRVTNFSLLKPVGKAYSTCLPVDHCLSELIGWQPRADAEPVLVLATCSVDGTPEATLVSHGRVLAADRIAVELALGSNAAKQLAERPRARLLLLLRDNRAEALHLDLLFIRGWRSEPSVSLTRELLEFRIISPEPSAVASVATETLAVRYYEEDASVFLDGQYLVKGLAGRMLWRMLNQYTSEGRRDFSNRELRLDPSLDQRNRCDNLEARLLLLRRRLAEREPSLRLPTTGRGRFRVEADRPIELERVSARG